MITLKKLAFEPNMSQKKRLPSVSFEHGLNFIVGEKSESLQNKTEQKKMNGVGKSLLIESINYCLFKKADESRVTKIPDISLDPSIYFCLDLEIELHDRIKKVQVKRNRQKHDPIIIIVDGQEKSFEKEEDAKQYFSHLFFGKNAAQHPSLRSLLTILIRDEESLYKDLLKPNQKSNLQPFEDLLKPHLYLFGVDLTIVERIKNVSSQYKLIDKILRSLRADFKKVGIAEEEVASYINDLKDKVEKLNLAIEALHPSEAVSQRKAELSDLQVKLEKAASAKASKEYLIKKIKSLPHPEAINTKQIRIVYNHFKSNLGDLVEKSLEDVLDFKRQIDDFQNALTSEKLHELTQEIQQIDNQIASIDDAMAKLYEKTEARQQIDSLKEAVKQEREKHAELDKLSTVYETLLQKENEKKVLKKTKASLIEQLGAILIEIGNTIASFEDDLKKMHDFIAGNKHCQFQLNISESLATFIEFVYRIRLDGSSGIDRIKTFIYDVLLMTNKFTSTRHPRFLIHDNIFASTGRDDMVKALNYLHSLSKTHRFQYIVTINKDEFDSSLEEFNFNVTDLMRAELTRQKPFLGFEYSEL